MNADWIKKMIRKDGERMHYYSTPELNSCLYLHFKGFRNIGGLEEFVGLKALWLEGNAIPRIEGLSTLKELRCLYLMDNNVSEIGSGLAGLEKLDTLNLSGNRIERIDAGNFSGLSSLSTLVLARNSISSAEDVSGLAACRSLSVLDLSNNSISDPSIVETLAKITTLRVLYLTGNPVIAAVPHYRRTLVCRLKSLTFLDDMPVFEKERRLAEAWERGGHEAEQQERAAMAQEQRERDKRNFDALDALMASAPGRDENPTATTTAVAGDVVVEDLEEVDRKPIVVGETTGAPDLEEDDPGIPVAKDMGDID